MGTDTTSYEIERKFLVKQLPQDLDSYPCHLIEQAYLNTNPVIRVRKQDDDYYLTYKGKGLLKREEYNLSLNEESYEHLLKKADGNIITKKRYLIPYQKNTIELDIFEGMFQGLLLAEVEFSSEEEAMAFLPPAWFGEDVTMNHQYSNSFLSRQINPCTVIS